MKLHRYKLLVTTTLVLVSALPFDTQAQRIPTAQRHVKETFLAGSEFEESMMDHLLNSTTLQTYNDDVASLLTADNFTYTLVSPEKPFVFVDRSYFWSQDDFNVFADADNTTTYAYVCFYNVSNDEGIFSQIHFPDGSELSEVVFGCESNKECCGMKCCGDDVLINIIIVGAISLALLFLLLCNILIGFKKRREKDRRDTTATYQATDVTNANDMSEVIHPDQITYETRHPAIAQDSQSDRSYIERLQNPTMTV